MNIDLHDFCLTFDLDDAPLWACPKCLSRSIKIKNSDIDYEFNVPTDDGVLDLDEFGEIAEAEGSFHAKVRCAEKSCRRMMSISGMASFKPRFREPCMFDLEPVEPVIIGSHIQVKPLLFHPPLDLMPLNGRAYANVPPEMTEILRGASTLFWLDQKACANRLRQAIEGILDLGGVDECSNLYTRIGLCSD